MTWTSLISGLSSSLSVFSLNICYVRGQRIPLSCRRSQYHWCLFLIAYHSPFPAWILSKVFFFIFYFFWRCEYYGVRHYLAVFSLLFLFWGVPFVRVGMGYII